MEHRHIDSDDTILTVAAAESILERGSDADFIRMMRRLRVEPFSQSADNALKAAEHAQVYGSSAIVRECIERWRSKHGVTPK